MTWRMDARARLVEKLAADEAKAKLRAMTGCTPDELDQMTAQAQRLADASNTPLSVALEFVAEQVAFPRPATPAPLAALRAEVEALRAEETAPSPSPYAPRTESTGAWSALSRVLDLIDKHAREGQ